MYVYVRSNNSSKSPSITIYLIFVWERKSRTASFAREKHSECEPFPELVSFQPRWKCRAFSKELISRRVLRLLSRDGLFSSNCSRFFSQRMGFQSNMGVSQISRWWRWGEVHFSFLWRVYEKLRGKLRNFQAKYRSRKKCRFFKCIPKNKKCSE